MLPFLKRYLFIAIMLPFLGTLTGYLSSRAMVNHFLLTFYNNESIKYTTSVKEYLTHHNVPNPPLQPNLMPNVSADAVALWLEPHELFYYQKSSIEQYSYIQLLTTPHAVAALSDNADAHPDGSILFKNLTIMRAMKFTHPEKGEAVLLTTLDFSALHHNILRFSLFVALPFIVIGLALTIVITVWTIQIGRMVDYVNKATKAYAQGDFSTIKSKAIYSPEARYITISLDHMKEQMHDKLFQLETRSDEFDSLFEVLGDPIFLIDENNYLERYNLQAAELLDFSKINHQQQFCKLFKYSNGKIIIEEGKKIFSNQIFTFGEKSYKVVGRKLINGHYLMMLTEVTNLVKNEQRRREFVANVSHELRTPIAAIKGYVETIQHHEINATEQKHFLSIIEDEADRISSIIEGLLRLSRLEEDSNALLKQYFSADDLLNSILNSTKANALQKKISITIYCPPDIELYADIGLTEEAVISLVENAIRYCPEKAKIAITASQNADKIEIKVSDNGPGIAIHDRDRLFERFYRGGDKGRGRSSGGVGLGLAIVHQVMLAHHGSLTLLNEHPGATFVLSFPTN